jgi:hypothetical protein
MEADEEVAPFARALTLSAELGLLGEAFGPGFEPFCLGGAPKWAIKGGEGYGFG